MKSDFKMVKADKGIIAGLLSGLLIAYAITCIFFIGCALGLTYTSLPETAVPVIMMAAVAVSVLVAGYDAAKSAPKNGWLWGMASGLIYAVILICIETFVSDGFMADVKTFISIALSLGGGCLGGVIGINFKRK